MIVVDVPPRPRRLLQVDVHAPDHFAPDHFVTEWLVPEAERPPGQVAAPRERKA
ncbi:hypothetical protein [Bradyrhizobium quebecense]|uniref:Uncharacterized protein n=2 Tax=Bradyrhizobium quebecense TaxID=2748629 RepID=A0ABS3M8V7_9BRAD|nr:hypothetical protein [Bradyrhizobium quebecense]UGY03287.1 hypothetical protein J4P68_0000445 [Bradyrhizobium quebecense]